MKKELRGFNERGQVFEWVHVVFRKVVRFLIPSRWLRAKLLGLPAKLLGLPHDLYISYLILMAPKRHEKALSALQGKQRLKVLFFVDHSCEWKRDKIYKRMLVDDNYEPMIVVCPCTLYDKAHMLDVMGSAYSFFKEKSYNVVLTYRKETGTWLDVKKELQPDIIYFSHPYDAITRPEYRIGNFLDVLTCYSSYAVMSDNLPRYQYDLDFHNLLWKHFVETSIHKAIAEKYARNKGSNVIVTGYPFCDVFLDGNYVPNKGVWKISNNDIKNIIWAPHHTIGDYPSDSVAFSNFLLCHQFMLDIAKKYQNRIQIAFKPHPILKPELYNHKDWGKQKTDEYYTTWENLVNGQLEDGDYVDLFCSSDAMILDSVSFIVEYMCTGKPSLFMVRDKSVPSRFNEFGLLALEALYKATSLEQVESFIETVVLSGQDNRKFERERFLETYFIPQNGKTASDNIFDSITSSVRKNGSGA